MHEGADAGLASATAKFKQCLTDDAKLQLFFQGKEGKATPAGSGGPSAFAQFVRTYFTAYRYSATQHIVGNVRRDTIRTRWTPSCHGQRRSHEPSERATASWVARSYTGNLDRAVERFLLTLR